MMLKVACLLWLVAHRCVFVLVIPEVCAVGSTVYLLYSKYSLD